MNQQSLAQSPEKISLPYPLLEKLLVMGRLWEEFLKDLRKFSQTKKLLGTIEDQSWYWTKRWQVGEKEADEDIRAGRISKAYTDVEELIADLRRGKL